MVVKVYVSGISGNKEVKKRQQRVLMILESRNVSHTIIDITEPGKEDEKDFMQQNSNPKDAKYPLPPQIFNDEVYCGDYEDFDSANEVDELEKFLKLVPIVSKSEMVVDTPPTTQGAGEAADVNGMSSSREASVEQDAGDRSQFQQITDQESEDEVIVLD